MTANLTQLLSEVESGEPGAPDRLLPLVYDELRALALHRMAQEKPGSTLQATALVHEAYLRLAGSGEDQNWSNRGHFFAAAAESMRRILVEAARSKSRLKRGGDLQRTDFKESLIAAPIQSEQVLAIHDALVKLDQSNPQASQLVKLRYFAGFTIEESAQAMDISPRKVNQIWSYARAWLLAEIGSELPEN